jgi:hypothetical protein
MSDLDISAYHWRIVQKLGKCLDPLPFGKVKNALACDMIYRRVKAAKITGTCGVLAKTEYKVLQST